MTRDPVTQQLAPPPPVPDNPFAAVSADDIAKAFTAWHRDARSNPDAFMGKDEVLAEDPEVSGVRSAEVFIAYLHQVASVVGLVLVALLLSTATAAAQTYIGPESSLRLTWEPGDPASQPPDEAYKVRLLSQPTPNSVRIVEFTTPNATTNYQVPYTALPAVPFYAAVRALRVVNLPGESNDSNVIGPFVKGTAVANPRTLSGTVVPTTP